MKSTCFRMYSLRNCIHIYLDFFFSCGRRSLESPLKKFWSSQRLLQSERFIPFYGVTDYSGPRAVALRSHGPSDTSISPSRCGKQVLLHSKHFYLPTYCLSPYFPNILNWCCSIWVQNLCISSKCILLWFLFLIDP